MGNDISMGIYAAALTPQNKNLDADVDLLYTHIKWLLSNGCHGVAIFGTTGEFASFGISERMDVLNAISNTDLPKNRILVGTGCTALTDTVKLSRHAIDNGFFNILVLPPFYYKSISNKGLFVYFDEIIRQIGDNRLRLYLYNFPKMTGMNIDYDLITHLHALYPKIVIGIKDSSGDLNNMITLCQQFEDFRVFAGTEVLLYDLLKAGGAGCISATANITSQLCSAIYTHWKSKDVSALQKHLSVVRMEIEKYPLIPALKAIMAELSSNKNWLYVRPPHKNLQENEADKLIEILKKLQILI